MSSIDPDLMRKETLDSAVSALQLELKYSLNDVPTDKEWRDFGAGLKGNQPKISEIINKRNPWTLKFAEKIPDFWMLLDRRLAS